MKPNKNRSCKVFDRIWETIPVAIYQTKISDGTFVMINPYGARMLGYDDPEDLIGKVKSSDLYCNGRRKELINQLNRDGVVTDFEICLNIKGKRVWVCATARLIEEEGVIEGSLTDITRRKEAEKELEVYHTEEAKILNDLQSKIKEKISEYERKTA